MIEDDRPLVTIACLLDDAGTHDRHSLQRCETLQRYLSVMDKSGQGDAALIAQGSGYTVEQLDSVRDRLAVLHVDGSPGGNDMPAFPALTGMRRIPADALAQELAHFPRLQLITLSGPGMERLAASLYEAGVPAVALLPYDEAGSSAAEGLYLALLQGRTLAQAWEEALAETPVWRREGLSIRYSGDDARAAGWRLRNPLLIPVAELEQIRKLRPVQAGAGFPELAAEPPRPEPVLTGSLREPGEGPDSRRRPVRKRPQKPGTPSGAPAFDVRILRRGLRIGIAVLLTAAATLAVWQYPRLKRTLKILAERLPGSEPVCPFPEQDKRYHVLVLPYVHEPDCSEGDPQLREDLYKRLDVLRNQSGYPVEFRSMYVADCNELNTNARELIASCNADLIVWGRYFTDPVTQQETFVLELRTANRYREQSYVQGTETLRRMPRNQLSSGISGLHTQVENLIFWALAYRSMDQGRYRQAMSHLGKIAVTGPEVETLHASALVQCYVRAGQFEQALAFFSDKIERQPRDPGLYCERAEIYAQLSRYEDALADYNLALTVDPANISGLLGRAALYGKMGATDQALRDLDQILVQNPDLAPVYHRRGEILAAVGRYPEAIVDFNKALAIHPEYAEAYLSRARVRSAQGQTDAAVADADHAVRLFPGYLDASAFLAGLYIAQGNWNEALAAYTRIITQQPSAAALTGRGEIFERMRKTDEALADYNRALELEPGHVAALTDRTRLYELRGEYALALTDLDSLLAHLEDDPGLWLAHGRVQTRLRRWDPALEDFNRSLERGGNPAEVLPERAAVYLARNMRAEALADASEALRLAPSNPAVLLLRARLLADEGRQEAALEDLGKVLAAAPQLAEAWVARGRIWLAQGKTSAALQDFAKALSIDPGLADAYRFRAQAYSRQGDTARAHADFDAAVRLAPQQAEAFADRADFFFRTGAYAQAIADYDEALRLGQFLSHEMRLRKIAMLEQTGQYAEALNTLNQLVRDFPDSARLYSRRGHMYREMGKISQAEKEFDQALQMEPGLPDAWLGRAALYAQLENYMQALESYNEALRQNPRLAAGYHARGSVYAQLETYDKALADFNQAIRLDPGLADAYRSRGDLFRKASDYPRALQDYSQAIRLHPAHADALYQRGSLYALQGRYDLAIADLRRSSQLRPQDGLRYGSLAKIYAQQRQDELFFQHIELALQHAYPAFELSRDPIYKPYQQHPRFRALLEAYESQK
ncbi:MAG: tetratricopeptide repeat protein [Bacteroidia bacterium]|nr:tetratricopeptide repeat protein [Bacteroidia bacterium]